MEILRWYILESICLLQWEYLFFMYSLVCLCAMITGQLVSVAVMYAVVNLLYGGAVIAIANVLTYVSYGLSYMEFVRKISATWFAPMLQLLNRVGFHPTMKKAGG